MHAHLVLAQLILNRLKCDHLITKDGQDEIIYFMVFSKAIGVRYVFRKAIIYITKRIYTHRQQNLKQNKETCFFP